MNPCYPALLLLAVAAASPSFAQDTSKVDNTAINQRDRHAESATPMDQPNDAADIRLAAAVRKAIVADDSLSTMGQNVKLIAAKGIVTLRGPVKDDAEKARIEAIAKGVPGVATVQNQLDTKH
ncbi:BON domain-containing protein [Luteibacter sp. 329MFSha]|uniref:BON domain-containing protein n=1 Tax=Luteibacter sp. 329MFSha TaxID=1798239 RepID=UPI0008BFB5F6|nr:BON domain-containing protein [Luteibacter sp. 329MFSha]SEV90917.1 BON domain-containing protein [Luteibacter sp. 329MFSha]